MMKIGGMELVVILIIALFAIGPERMPKVARKLGGMLRDFKKALNGATEELREASEEFREVTDEIDGVRKSLQNTLRDTDREVQKAVNGPAKPKEAEKPQAPAQEAQAPMQEIPAQEADAQEIPAQEAQAAPPAAN